MSTAPVPHPKEVRDLFEGILGREIDIAAGEPVTPNERTHAAVGVFVEDNLSLSAAIVADLQLTAYAGAALGLVPRDTALKTLANNYVDETMWENFAEVLSVSSTLLNHDGAPHVRLYSSYEPGTLPPADVSGFLQGLGRRLDLTVSIAGYGSGCLSIVRTL
jgi:hypothetical protein